MSALETDSPQISVLMGVYNGLPYLRESIESILGQTYRNFEFLIVDDASTDETAEVVSEYAERDDRVRLIENEENRGLTWSLNRALDEARGEFVARQDADDISAPSRFDKQVEYLEVHPSAAVVGTAARIIDGDGMTIDRRTVLESPSLADLRDKNHVIHGSIMGRRSVLEDVGGYDEFFRYSQDHDLWLRLASAHSIRNISESLYILREHQESIYIEQTEESTLYSVFARGTSTGDFDAETVRNVRREGITSLYEQLTDSQRAAFHESLARVYVRYDRPELGRGEAIEALRCSKSAVGAYLSYGLSFLNHRHRSFLRRLLRKALNTRYALRNAT